MADRTTTASTVVEQLSELPAVTTAKSPENAPEDEVAITAVESPEKMHRGLRFWVCIFALAMSDFLIALDIVSKSPIRKHSEAHTFFR